MISIGELEALQAIAEDLDGHAAQLIETIIDKAVATEKEALALRERAERAEQRLITIESVAIDLDAAWLEFSKHRTDANASLVNEQRKRFIGVSQAFATRYLS